MRKSQLSISDDLRAQIKAIKSNEMPLSPHIYDPMQQHVEATIRDNIYPSFLCSEMYIQYIQQMSAVQERFSSSAGSSGSGGSSVAGACALLPSASSSKQPQQQQQLQQQQLLLLPSSSGSAALPPGVFINLPVNSGGGGGGSMLPAGTCSASGSVYGPSTSASSSGSISATDTLPRSSTLPTLHEDSELSLCDDFEKVQVEGSGGGGGAGGGGRVHNDYPMRLTRDLLIATQKRRLEIRPPGYVMNLTRSSFIFSCRLKIEHMFKCMLHIVI